MQKHVFIGTDVSKPALDHAIKTSEAHLKTPNNLKVYKQWLKWALGFGSKEELWIVMEHTGYYSYPFELFLQEQQIVYTKVSALEIKRSAGLVRGKSDKVDAFTISRYAWLRREELQVQKVPVELITELKDLLTLRDKLVRERSGYKARVKELNATRQ